MGRSEGSELDAVDRCSTRSLFVSRGLPSPLGPARGFNNPLDGIVWLGRGEVLALEDPEGERMGSCNEELRGGTTVPTMSSAFFFPFVPNSSWDMRLGVFVSSTFLRYASCRAGVEGSCKSKVAPEVDSNWDSSPLN